MTAPRVVTVTLNPALDWTLSVPHFAAGQVNRVESERTRAGGKGVNVAAALAPSCRVTATGFLGRENDATFTRFFDEHDIDDAFIRIDGATRVGIKIVSDETTDINFPGAAVNETDLAALRDRLMSLAREKPYVVLAGSLPPGVPGTIYRDLCQELKRAGCRVALDTSGDALRHAIEAAPDAIKPNIHELEALTGHSLRDAAAIFAAARALIARGIGLIAVSMGERGALFVDNNTSLLARPPAITVGSTVGAGDAMVAGIVAAQLNGANLDDLARTATAFSLRALGGGNDLDALRARATILAYR